jgi:hypothetical protein
MEQRTHVEDFCVLASTLRYIVAGSVSQGTLILACNRAGSICSSSEVGLLCIAGDRGSSAVDLVSCDFQLSVHYY